MGAIGEVFRTVGAPAFAIVGIAGVGLITALVVRIRQHKGGPGGVLWWLPAIAVALVAAIANWLAQRDARDAYDQVPAESLLELWVGGVATWLNFTSGGALVTGALSLLTLVVLGTAALPHRRGEPSGSARVAAVVVFVAFAAAFGWGLTDRLSFVMLWSGVPLIACAVVATASVWMLSTVSGPGSARLRIAGAVLLVALAGAIVALNEAFHYIESLASISYAEPSVRPSLMISSVTTMERLVPLYAVILGGAVLAAAVLVVPTLGDEPLGFALAFVLGLATVGAVVMSNGSSSMVDDLLATTRHQCERAFADCQDDRESCSIALRCLTDNRAGTGDMGRALALSSQVCDDDTVADYVQREACGTADDVRYACRESVPRCREDSFDDSCWVAVSCMLYDIAGTGDVSTAMAVAEERCDASYWIEDEWRDKEPFCRIVRRGPPSPISTTGAQAPPGSGTPLNEGPCSGVAVEVCHQRGLAALHAGEIEQAIELLDPTCAAGFYNACSPLWTALDRANSRLDPTTVSAIFDRYDQDCGAGDLSACLNVGILLRARDQHVRAFGYFNEGCHEGLAPACVALSLRYDQGRGVAENGTQAFNYAERACELGDMMGCSNLGHYYMQGRGVQPDEEQGVRLARQACEAGVAQGCVNLAAYVDEGRGISSDPEYRLDLLGQACVLGRRRACVAAGDLHREGVGVAVPENPERALELYEAGCDQLHASSCYELASMLQLGQGVSPDLERASQIHDENCGRGSVSSCTALGVMYQRGHGVPQDDIRAREYAEAGCEADDLSACSNLAHYFMNGMGGDTNTGEAVRLWSSGCEGGHPVSCRVLAGHYASGEAISRDHEESVRLSRRGCELGDPGSCNQLGLRYLQGQGVAADAEQAVNLFVDACFARVGVACFNLAHCRENGLGVEADPEIAALLVTQACEYGYDPACPD